MCKQIQNKGIVTASVAQVTGPKRVSHMLETLEYPVVLWYNCSIENDYAKS
jgi:hypothetical protein